MKKLLLKLFLLISIAGYSQNATIGALSNGARTVTFTNPTAIQIVKISESNSTVTTPAAGREANGKVEFTISGGTPSTSGSFYNLSLKKGGTEYLNPSNFTITPQPGNLYKVIVTGLDEGIYVASAKDSKECISSNNPSFTINKPLSIIVNDISNYLIPCYGGKGALTQNGASRGAPYGGTPSYTYYWLQKTSSTAFTQIKEGPSADNLNIGIYKLIVEDQYGNKGESKEINVTENPNLIVTPVVKNATCIGSATGTINLNISSSVTSIIWTGIEIGTAAITNNGKTLTGKAGAYTYTIKYGDNCTYTNIASIDEPTSALNASATFTQPTTANNNGRITIAASGGIIAGQSASYTYIWKKVGDATFQPGSVSQLTNLSNGTYNITVISSSGCEFNIPSVKLEALQISSNQITKIKCKGGTGSISVTATGGTIAVDYKYKWFKNNVEISPTTSTITGQSEGTYRVEIRDDNNVMVSENYPLTDPALLEIEENIALRQNVSCNGAGNGKIFITAKGGTGAYKYLWSNGSTAQNPENLIKGKYSVKVTDANECIAELKDIEITEPDPISIPTPTVTKVAIFGQSTGSISIGNIIGGNPGQYYYSWTSNIGFTSASKNISGLKAGIYYLTVSDSKSCTSQTLTVNITQSDLLQVDIKETNFIKCNGDSNGVLTAEVIGGIPPYKYKWSKNGTEISGLNTAVISGRDSGNYSVLVTDSANPAPGPYATAEKLNYTLAQPNQLIVSVLNKKNVLCYGASTGEIVINIAGGTAPYTQVWTRNGQLYSGPLDKLTAGIYNVTVTDKPDHGCTASLSQTVEITQPAAPLKIDSQLPINLTGFQTNNGSITVTVSGGTPTYTYEWTKDASVAVIGTTNKISNLSAGIYHLIVKDANGCSLPQTDYIISQPDKLEIVSLTRTPNTNILCNGNKLGEFTAVVTGGVKEYTFEWLNNTTGEKYTSTEVIGTTSTSSKASSLGAGNYIISVKDQNNNTLYGTNTFTITQPDILAFTYTKQDVSCYSGNNGTITLNITGGTKNTDVTKPYNIVSSGGVINSQTGVISGLTKGTYTVKVSDANGCQTLEQIIGITEPVNSVYIASSAITPTTGFGLSTGKVTVTVSGGTTGYTYQWKNSLGTLVGTNSPNLNNVPSDTYTLLVTDAQGCTTGNNYIVPQPTKPVLTETHLQAKCNGLFGSLNAITTGGASYNQNQADRSYTYKLRNKISGTVVSITGNTANFTNIADGNYALTATDIAGVDSNSIDVTFTQPTPIIVTLALSLNVSCYGGQDGLIAVNVTGGTPFIVNGTPEYTYIWKKKNTATNLYENFTPASLSALYEGIYAVEVRDANYNAGDTSHCVGFLNDIIITQPADFGFEIDKMTYQNPTAVNGNDGALHFEIKGGKTNYEYKLYKKDALGNETVLKTISNTSAKMVDFNNLIKDHYYVSVQDDTGCTKYTDFDFTDNPLTITISQTQNITCFESNNGILKAVVNGGFGIKTISWYRDNVLLPNEHNAELLNVKIGNYYAVVKDTKAIEVTTGPLTVTQPDMVTFSTVQEPVKCLGDNNGTITINAAGGNSSFRYRYFNNGTLVQDWTNFSNASSTIITGLADGEYNIQVQDTQQCASIDKLVKITSPTALAIDNIISVPATGKGLSNGSISITALGANGNYGYNWFKANGSTINQTTAKAINLAAGKYYIIITDAKGCNLTSPLIEVTEPPLLETSISIQNVVLCNGDKNGSLIPSTTGGLLKPGENYTYQWFEIGNTTILSTNTILSNIGKGSYYVIAKDSNGNLATSQTLLVTEPNVLNNVLSSDYVRCGDFDDWTIDAAPTGGTLPYTYAWNTGAKTASIQNVTPGYYSVTVTDNHGCNITKTITLTAPAHLDAAEVIKIPTCYEGSDATITVTTIAGTAPFKYLWNTGETSNILKNASAGEYSVEITDARGCIILRKYTIENPPKDVIDLGPDVTLCFDQTLTINATIDDDKATYFWTSDKGFTSNKAMITVSEPANYTVVVTNKLGCKATDTIKISSQQTAISAEFAVSSQVFKNEKFIIVDISNPAADTVEWVIPANATIISKNDDFAEISFSEAGEYDITINTTKGNCTAYQTKTVLVTEGEYEEENPDTQAKNFDLKIYPNPSSGNFTVDATLDKVMPANVKVYSLNNNVLIDSKADNGKSNYLFNFSLNGLPSGIYFVLFESQQGSKLRKIIIQ
ncbi:T9SS type A sorting domain-containing protein [Flavobacterium ginsengiterrae]|uniref:Secretion system C-terminal sorting domain-containing protein n=1 Tax=Flavobacterium ginsengiterrae TaxID=871695 RepID=A0ABP7GLE8_9FLAO